MDRLLYGLFFFFVMLTGFVIQSAVATLDVSTWNFAGSQWAKAIVPHLGLIYITICIAGMVFVVMGRRKR